MATNPSPEPDRVIELFRLEAARRQQLVIEPLPVTPPPPPLSLPRVRDLPVIRDLPAPAEHVTPDLPAYGRLPELTAPPAPPDAPPLPELAVTPAVSWWRSVKSAKETIDRLLRDAREKTQGPRWLPKFLRGLFRRQGRYNRTLLEATTLLGKKNEELRKQVRELTDAVQAQSRWLEHLAAFSREDSSRVNAQFATLAAALRDSHTVFSSYTSSLVETRRADEQWMDAVSDAVRQPPPLDDRITNVHADLQILRSGLNPIVLQVQERINLAAEQLYHLRTEATHRTGELREVRWDVMNVAEDVRTLRSTLENARAEASRVRADVAEFRETTGGTSEAVARVEAHLSQASVRLAHLEQLASHLADRTGESLARLDERLGNDIVYLKAQLSQHTSRLEQIAAPAGAPKAGAKTRARAASKQESEDDQQLDAFYLAFENEFRGSRDLIQQRLEAYLPFLERAEVSGKRGGILDLGCGRGEWLELLQARGYEQVRGVDLNTSMIEQCRGRGLDVVHADALEHLRALPDASVELVASFHLIEHLPFRALLEFLRHIQRVLLPGGLTILETPNPRNILVGASDFFRDMTHNHPIHPDTIRFTVETIGMADVGCYFLQDEARGRKPIRDTDYVFDDLRSYVDVPRDYAVIARKT